jgi:nucleoside-diphosphate-sugar epimerase
MKIILTGATGFIGSHLLRRLVKNHEVVVLKRLTSNISRIADVNFKSYNVDQISLDEIFEIEKPEIVIHLATYYSKFHKSEEIKEMMYSNVTFPTLILETMKKHKVKFFINTGTFFEYAPCNEPLCEDAKCKPFNLYASTKMAFEQVLQHFNGVGSITLKIFSPYGLQEKPHKLIPALIEKIKNNESMDMTAGEQKLDYTFVEDIVDAFELSIPFVMKTERYEAFNIGSGNAVSLKELIETVANLMQKKSLINFGAKPYAHNELMFVQADITKARGLLNWSPKHLLTEGLKKIL